MKKGVKGLLVLSVGLLLAGCGCNKNENEENNQIENVYDEKYVYDDVSTNLTELYNETVKSTVKVIAKGQIGSGVVYKEEGNYAYILTNAHVLTDSVGNNYYSEIDILFSNYNRVKGTFIYLDKNADVAVISVAKSEDYTVAKIIASDTDVKVGDSVYTIGNPSGIDFSITTGVISANRFETTTDYISGTKETTTYVYNSTATINPGNSGGPMFNSKGEVIAINTMRPVTLINGVQVEPGDKRNHNYSIPINYFIKVANYIVTNRASFAKSYLDLEVKSLCDYSTTEIQTMEITVKKGVHVTSSSETEVAKGRIITHVNGAEVATEEDFEFELLKYSKDETIQLTTVDSLGNNSKTVNVRVK